MVGLISSTLDMLSRLKGIETLSTSVPGTDHAVCTLDMLSRLKGIETQNERSDGGNSDGLLWICFPV